MYRLVLRTFNNEVKQFRCYNTTRKNLKINKDTKVGN